MDVKLVVIGFRPLKLHPYVYIHEDETGFVTATLYVDDILFFSAGKILLNNLKKQLMDRFGMSDMGDSRASSVRTSPAKVKTGPSLSARTTKWRTWYSAKV